MSLVEKAQEVFGITPAHSTDGRESVRREAATKATSEWFQLVLRHHMDIEAAFTAVEQSRTVGSRASAQDDLAAIITGHAVAEEAIVYPSMKLDTSATDAIHAYTEHATVKMQLAALDKVPNKFSKDYDDKLEKIRTAICHHMIEEERDFFPALQAKASIQENHKISQRYKSEFDRYMPSRLVELAA